MSQHPHYDPPPLDAPSTASGSAILVVDGDPAFQLGLKTYLREYVGYDRVFAARSGQEALDFVRADPSIEVVTIDREVPGMDGFELLDALRAQAGRPLAVVMVTDSGEEGLEGRFLALGGGPLIPARLLPKPIQFERLEPAVLAAQEEVVRAKRRAEASASGGGGGRGRGSVGESSLDGLAERIGEQSQRIAELEGELRALRGKWRADFWKVVAVLLLAWLAIRLGVVERLQPHRERAVEVLKEVFTLKGAEKSESAPAVETD
jgi:CheY-like chemotaxis protein